MAILNKIKASTLMETLVATVLIVVIFVITSMTLNSIFYNTIKSRTLEIDAYLNELEYNYQHGNVSLPYQDEFYDWDIRIYKTATTANKYIVFEAVNHKLSKDIIRTVHGD